MGNSETIMIFVEFVGFSFSAHDAPFSCLFIAVLIHSTLTITFLICQHITREVLGMNRITGPLIRTVQSLYYNTRIVVKLGDQTGGRICEINHWSDKGIRYHMHDLIYILMMLQQNCRAFYN